MTLPQTACGDSATDQAVVAAFDFDGTLTRGGSVIPFLVTLRGAVPVLAAVLRAAPKLLRAALFDGEAADESKEMIISRVISGMPEAKVNEVAGEFAQRHLARRLRPEVRDRLEWHRAQGHKILVVSASPENYVKAAGQTLEVDGVLATRLAVDSGGLMIGRYEGKNCRGAVKYARVVGWLRSSGLAAAGASQPVLWAYGNSRGDLRLLEAADYGVDAGQLGRVGRLRRFPRLADVMRGGTRPSG